MRQIDKLLQDCDLFMKSAQALGPNLNDHEARTWHLIDKRTAPAKATYWLELISNANRPRRVGWSNEILKTILIAVMQNEPDPIREAQDKFDISTTDDTRAWAIADAEGHYSDLIPINELKKLLSLY